MGGPVPTAEALGLFRVCSRRAEQSPRGQLCSAGFRREVSREKKTVSRRISVLAFAAFHLRDSPRGNFSASLTSFLKRPVKRREIKRQTKVKESKASN